MPEELIGTWSLAEGNNEDFNKYLEALGVGFVIRKAILALKPDVTICINGDTWCIKTVSTFKTKELSFKLNTEFEEATADGRNVKTIVTLEDGVLKQKQMVDGKENLMTRGVKDGRMITTLSYGEVKCVRIFDRK
ncbi:fatty acid-binding protein, adipocyte-like [Pseudophryne corroboree]|uniref:fatty acid-binding protein, adipocyte-like n=1 Tax=Pseudophryne corroboree TaxID=495146 RepID=UPI003081A5B1